MGSCPCTKLMAFLRATLLLAHARDQILNQKRLEAYLASAQALNLDIASQLQRSHSNGSRSSSRYRSQANGASGANTPRDLTARIKVLELYTLHVLVRNDEWEYAREFITVNSLLDEERREAFLQALQSLQEEQQEQHRVEREERQKQEDKLRRDAEEAKRVRAEQEEVQRRRAEEDKARREGSEVDYGIESTPLTARATNGRTARPSLPPAGSKPRSSLSKPKAKAPGPLTLTARATLLVTRLRAIVEQLGASLNSNPILVTRFIVFVMGFLLMLGNKGMRERLQRILGTSWGKVKATAGMGTKVSYI